MHLQRILRPRTRRCQPSPNTLKGLLNFLPQGVQPGNRGMPRALNLPNPKLVDSAPAYTAEGRCVQ
jgi:hypothetical protein